VALSLNQTSFTVTSTLAWRAETLDVAVTSTAPSQAARTRQPASINSLAAGQDDEVTGLIRLVENTEGDLSLSVSLRRLAYPSQFPLNQWSTAMYINGFVIPVPEDKKAEYQDIAEKYWEIARDYGALSVAECWEADIKDGKLTDFRRAVNLEPGEKVVFSWMTWKDRATAEASHDKIMAHPRMKQFGDTSPFDGKRMIYGGFEPLVMREAK
jgi:uncharacterized protein YbaA (DUF1428 family)